MVGEATPPLLSRVLAGRRSDRVERSTIQGELVRLHLPFEGVKTLWTMPIRVGMRPVIIAIRDGVHTDSAEYLHTGKKGGTGASDGRL